MKKSIVTILFFYFFAAIISAQNGQTKTDSSLVIETALNYADGFYSRDASRMEKAIHPDLNKVCPMLIPQTGKTFLIYSSWSELIELSRDKATATEEKLRKIKVSILKISDEVACAMLTSAQFNDYLIMCKIEGQWKIITVLWTFGEDSPNHVVTNFKAEDEKPAIELTLKNLIEGVYNSDVAAVESILHPEYRRSSLILNPNTGKCFIQKDAVSRMIESVRAKMGAMPKEKWNILINVLNSMDNIAFAEVTTNAGTSYYQLAKIDNNWKVINVFRRIVL